MRFFSSPPEFPTSLPGFTLRLPPTRVIFYRSVRFASFFDSSRFALPYGFLPAIVVPVVVPFGGGVVIPLRKAAAPALVGSMGRAMTWRTNRRPRMTSD